MNTLEIRPGDSGVKLYLNGVELEDVVRYSLASADLQRAEFTVTVKIEHPHAGFAPADIIDFASEIKRVPVKLNPKHLANVIHGTDDSEKSVCPVNCSLEDLGMQTSADKKVMEYLERAERYACTPLGQRDPAEFKALMALKAEIYKEWREQHGISNDDAS